MVPGQFVPVPAPEVVKMGAVGSVPAGLGVVEGDTIPYKPEALEKKKDNQKNWLTSDPEIKCYLPGVPRANYMPYPFQIFQSKDYVVLRVRVRGRRAQHLYEGSGAAARRLLDGSVRRQVGRRHAGRRRSRASTTRPGSTAPATTTATR